MGVGGVHARTVRAVAPLAVGEQMGEIRGCEWQTRLADFNRLMGSVAGEIQAAVAVATTDTHGRQ